VKIIFYKSGSYGAADSTTCSGDNGNFAAHKVSVPQLCYLWNQINLVSSKAIVWFG
jgi:hypothetical protein